MTDLDELERLLRHSTPAPWDAEGNSVRSLQPWSASGLVATTSMAPDMQDAEDNAALIVALRNAAEELIRDARRMEWAEANMNAIDTVSHPDNLVMIWYGPRESSAAGRTLRVAIDAAIAQEGKP